MKDRPLAVSAFIGGIGPEAYARAQNIVNRFVADNLPPRGPFPVIRAHIVPDQRTGGLEVEVYRE